MGDKQDTSSEQEEDRRFAAGENYVNDDDGCRVACPVMTVYDDDDLWSQELADFVWEYDQLAKRRTAGLGTHGVLSEAQARECWLDTIEMEEDKDCEDQAEAGREIARELGWLDDDE